MMRRIAATTLCAIAVVALTSCADTQTLQPSNSATATQTASERPADQSDPAAELYGPDAMTLGEYVDKYPQFAPSGVRGGEFLLEESATSSQDFALPAATMAADSLVLTIFCDADSAYEVAVKRGQDLLDRTWGPSCPRSGILMYTTAPIVGPLHNLTVHVAVDDGTPYRVSIVASDPALND